MVSDVADFAPSGPAPRTPPHNLDAEMALLGAVLANNANWHKIADVATAADFANPVHARIYTAMGRLVDRGAIADPVTLKTYFEQDGGLAEIGGPRYLMELAGAAIGVIDPRHYATLIHDLHLRRQLIDVGEDVINDAYDVRPDQSGDAALERAEGRLFRLAEQGTSERGFSSLGDATTVAIEMAQAAYGRDSHVTGVTSGLRDLDRKLGGLHRSDLIILAGRPSMGKTALATNIAFNAAEAFLEDPEAGAQVAFFSLEMSAEQLATRILAERTGVPSDKIRRGEVRGDDFPRFVEAATMLNRVPFHIDDTPAVTVGALRARARRLKRRQGGLGLIVVDYLQLLRSDSPQASENRVLEISEITRGLKALAKELDCPVLALSQLSRAVEQREDKRPQLADLRESGSIEQDADVVIFVYRDQYYHERREPRQREDESDEKFHERTERWMEHGAKVHNRAEAIIAKQRHGPIGTVHLFFDGQLTKFGDLADSDHIPESMG